MDGQVVGELRVRVENGKVVDKNYVSHRITEKIKTNPQIAALIDSVRKPLVAGPQFKPGEVKNPFRGARLRYPIDTVIGQTQVALHRTNFRDARMPAVLQDSTQDFLFFVFF